MSHSKNVVRSVCIVSKGRSHFERPKKFEHFIDVCFRFWVFCWKM